MEFNNHADEIIKTELTVALKQRDIIIEHEIKELVHQRYGLSMQIISESLERVCSEMGLIRRRVTTKLKNIYNLDNPGFPYVYLLNN